MLLDIHGERLELMEQCNVDHFVLVNFPEIVFEVYIAVVIDIARTSGPCEQSRSREIGYSSQ